ncbi:hypothetical protein FTO74_01735 [Granulicella sp. WH15]|uniref:hypothetical protein n=1 Tax=Granulicella sp. WH15 TaxID=2602070 RepID=UPI001366D4A8|nr:hypothetical protein [Granulicella sp. WH15]QHN02237.1 hypothetical protein FTO74_01735 [Granulicella sp. WH15]
MIDETQAANQDRVGFCQNCGKPLNKETIRVVGTAVYCEPCLAAKLGAPPPYAAGSGQNYGYNPVDPGVPPGATTPLISGTPNPALAALLGLIPGVGAMYNEQYAKGIVHLVIFAVLVSLSHTADILGLLVAGWIFYMAIEAHHTARARRDGTPLPNPFGFNDIGERLGFGKSWPQPPAPQQPGQTPPAAAPTNEPTRASWGAPTENYPPPSVPPTQPYGAAQPGQTGPYGQSTGYVPNYSASYVTGYPPFSTPINAPLDIPPPRSRFPVGAIWLIALGTFFLIGNSGLFHGLPPTAVVGVGMIGLSIWIFIRKMTAAGAGIEDDGSPMYRVRVLRALRGSVWVLLVGVLLLLNSLHWIEWERSWPYFIILAGVMAVLERTAYNAAAAEAYRYPPAGYPPSAPPSPNPPAPQPEERP